MLRIYHTSDLHDRRGIAEPLIALRKSMPGLLVDCGDALHGSQTMVYPREPVIDEMNLAGYDLGAPGNREFHYLHRVMQQRISRMRRPLVCSNLIDSFRRPLPFLREYWMPFDERRVVRFFGLLVTQYPQQSMWERVFGWRFLDPIRVAREVADSATSDEVVILLSHLGLAMDRRLAEEVPRIDLILGGHSHDTLHTPEYVGPVPIVHAGPYGRFVSCNELQFDARRDRVRLTSSRLLPLLPLVRA